MINSKLLIILPTYKEYANLATVTASVWRVVPEAHILIVDDASGDGTPEWCKKHESFSEKLFLLERPEKVGLGAAYINSFEWIRDRPYEYIIQMDADRSHSPQDIPLFLEKLAQGSDVVLGTRYKDGIRVLNWPLSRMLLSMGAALYVKLFTRMPYSDPTSGFKGFKAAALKKLELMSIHSNGYGFQIEVTHWFWKNGFKISEVPIVFEGRHFGTSKMTTAIAREAFWLVFRLGKSRFV